MTLKTHELFCFLIWRRASLFLNTLYNDVPAVLKTVFSVTLWKQCYSYTVTNLNLITKYHCYCICLSGHLTLLGWLFNKLLTFTVLVQQTKHIGFPIMPRKTITDSGYKFLQIGQKTCSEEQFLIWFQI